MRLDDSTLVTLGQGVHVLARGQGAVQFGMDATRSGIVDSRAAPALAATLTSTKWPVSIGELQEEVVGRCGVDKQQARSLIDDLCGYNILIPSARTAVAVLGDTHLAHEISRILEASGATVRIRLQRETTRAFLQRHVDSPLVVVDGGREYLMWGKAVKRHGNWVVPVLSFDSRVLVGPVSNHPTQACGMCAHMHISDHDPHAHVAAEQLADGPRTMDPAVAAVGAAAAAVTVRRLAGIPDPPGVVAEPPGAGWAAVVDPLGAEPLAPLQMEPHPRCLVCASF